MLPPSLDPTSALTAWHCLTPIGNSDSLLSSPSSQLSKTALWTGGYTLLYDSEKMHLASELRGNPLQVITFDAGNPQVKDLSDVLEDYPDRFKVAYHSDLQLYDGSIMLSGGHNKKNEKLFMASSDVSIFRLEKDGSVVLDKNLYRMYIERLGHRTTRLLDNTVLITGGIYREENKEREKDPNKINKIIVTDLAERFNPRRGESSEDYPFNRPPPKDGDPQANDGVNITCTLFEE
jgi:hypothetical protein